MRIVIDTNVICGDYLLRTPTFHTLLNAGPEIEHRLLVPRIVLDETVHRYSEDLRAWRAGLEKTMKTGKRLLTNPPSTTTTDSSNSYEEPLLC